MTEQRVGGVEFSGLPYLVSWRNSNLTSGDMAYLQRQGISVDDDNEPYRKNIKNEVP